MLAQVTDTATLANDYINNQANRASYVSKYYHGVETSSDIKNFQHYLEIKKKVKNGIKLSSYRNLDFNWNNNQEEPFPHTLLKKCQSLINDLIIQPDVFPTGRGSIQFEYEKKNGEYLEFELYEDKIEYFYMDENDEEKEDILPFNIDILNRLVIEFYG